MRYYGFTENQYSKIMSLLNTISVTGVNQIGAFHEATEIFGKPAIINCAEEGANDGKEIQPD